MSYGPNPKEEVEAAMWGNLVKGPDFTWNKLNNVCCKVHQCTSQVVDGWKDEADEKTPCEDDEDDLEIVNPPGADAWTHGLYQPMQVKGSSASNWKSKKSKCFALKKHFR